MGLSLASRFESPRVLLRPLRASDLDGLIQVAKRSAEHLRPWSPVTPARLSLYDETSARIAHDRRAWRAGHGYAFALVPKGARDPIGRVALSNLVRGVFQNAYLGYWIDRDHAGQGLMTEAVRTVLDVAFGPLGLHRVQAAIIPTNAPSLSVVRRIGFREEGLAHRYLQIAGSWQDHQLFALTAEEWPRTIDRKI